jgi:DNA-binding transcriptional regulator LsrR (DeoR family)
MPTEKLNMRKIKQILQLHYKSGLSRRTIAATAGTSYGSVANYLNRAEKAGIWECRSFGLVKLPLDCVV